MKIDLNAYKKLYFCDPEKNVDCPKDECYAIGGVCYKTSCKSYELSGIKKLAAKTKYALDRRAH